MYSLSITERALVFSCCIHRFSVSRIASQEWDKTGRLIFYCRLHRKKIVGRPCAFPVILAALQWTRSSHLRLRRRPWEGIRADSAGQDEKEELAPWLPQVQRMVQAISNQRENGINVYINKEAMKGSMIQSRWSRWGSRYWCKRRLWAKNKIKAGGPQIDHVVVELHGCSNPTAGCSWGHEETNQSD